VNADAWTICEHEASHLVVGTLLGRRPIGVFRLTNSAGYAHGGVVFDDDGDKARMGARAYVDAHAVTLWAGVLLRPEHAKTDFADLQHLSAVVDLDQTRRDAEALVAEHRQQILTAADELFARPCLHSSDVKALTDKIGATR
jgi:hypothetical protein